MNTSEFIHQFNQIYPNLLTKSKSTDICELFQSIIDILNQSLSKQQPSPTYSSNIIEQVQNKKLTTLSIDQLNRFFTEIETQVERQSIPFENSRNSLLSFTSKSLWKISIVKHL